MESLIIRLLINAAGLWLADYALAGIQGPSNPYNYLVLALIFGFVNSLIRPVLSFLTCPLIILTLGIFTVIINAAMLLLTSYIAINFGIIFRVVDFTSAVLGAIIISVVSIVLTVLIQD
jgi:putative membrane protein